MSKRNLIVSATLALTGALGTAQAREVDVQWSVVIGAPFYTLPVPAYARPMPVYTRPAPVWIQPAPVYRQGAYQQPTRWDYDGDRIPNRHDRLYNPQWDRDGDGIANRYDRHDARAWQGR